MKVIINADDFGMSHEVNLAIVEAIENGCISSTTIMANAPAFEEAVELSKLYPQVSFGTHLNIIEFPPLTNKDVFAKYGLTGEDGCFIKKQAFLIKHFPSELVQAVYEEWTAQIKKIKGAGIHISHIDSHQHAHGIQQLREILAQVMRENGIDRVRRQYYTTPLVQILKRKYLPKPSTTTEATAQKANKPTTKRHNFAVRRIFQLVNGLRHWRWIKAMQTEFTLTSAFYDYRLFSFLYVPHLKNKNLDVVELMCHPGHKNFQEETQMLMAKKLNELCDFELISYNQLEKQFCF